MSEAERMAGIVKKIGKITKYETTDYVGTAKMLDLDRAAASDSAIPIEAQESDDKTGEFTAVASAGTAQSAVLANTPSIEDLLDLADRHGGKR